MMEAVHHYGGHVAQTTGDGIFALFGAAIAYEDHPQRALFPALRMQAEVRRYAERLRAEKGVSLQVRVGANSGEVVVREIRTGEKHGEYVPIGHSASVASRLQALAAPGSIAISESMRKLVEGYFALKSLGPARIKGVSEPLGIYEVTGLGPLRTRLQRAAARGYTKFVGRERDMEALRHAAEQARAGRGQIVATMAEAGVGKERSQRPDRSIRRSSLCSLSRLALQKDVAPERVNFAKKLVGRWVSAAVAATQSDERLKSIFQSSFLLLVGEACQPSEVPPIATSAISSKPRGELACDERAQKAIRKDSSAIQPHLEIIGRSLDHHRRLETRLALVGLYY